MRTAVLIAVALLLALPLCVAQADALPQAPMPPQEKWQVEVQPGTLVNGAPYLLRVVPPEKLQALSGSWLGSTVYLNPEPKSDAWYGLMGVGLTTVPGEYPLVLTGVTTAASTVTFEQKLYIGAETYPVEEIHVAPQFVKPSPRLLQRIKREMALKRQVFSRTAPHQEWSGKFVRPVKTSVSEIFGTGRSFNGELQRRHEGLDYHARPGTRVVSINSGTVRLARPFFYEGNCVVIDHGQGLFTLYMHLSRFRVKEGQRVKGGQLLGLSGSTGRVTGPHLHVGVRWQGIYLDPARLLQLSPP
jgi:murein DD-endopeptidase MepM/ murein hydrolase activator NlpD